MSIDSSHKVFTQSNNDGSDVSGGDADADAVNGTPPSRDSGNGIDQAPPSPLEIRLSIADSVNKFYHNSDPMSAKIKQYIQREFHENMQQAAHMHGSRLSVASIASNPNIFRFSTSHNQQKSAASLRDMGSRLLQ